MGARYREATVALSVKIGIIVFLLWGKKFVFG